VNWGMRGESGTTSLIQQSDASVLTGDDSCPGDDDAAVVVSH
jgi:hypothetical protein